MIKDTRKGFNRASARSEVLMRRFLEATPGGKLVRLFAPTVSASRGFSVFGHGNPCITGFCRNSVRSERATGVATFQYGIIKEVI